MKVRMMLCTIGGVAALALSLAARSPQTGAVPDSQQQFFDAIRKGDSARTLELLKQHPALMRSTYRNGITPVLFAVYAHHKEIAELLISTAKIEPNIFEAAATGRIERVRELLKQDPALVHAWSADGWTALHLNFDNLEMAKLLIESGADVNVNSRNTLNATPLQGAAANDWIELAKLYLAHGANVNCRSEGGGSPLHEAAGNGFLDFARMLIESGADVNQKDDSGKTPLAIAVQYKRAQLVDFLRAHGGTM